MRSLVPCHPWSSAALSTRRAQEETCIPRRALRLVCRGRPLRVDDGALSFLVHPLLFSTTEGLPLVTLNWENDEARWVLPDEAAGFDAVPSLVRVNLRRACIMQGH